jgi:hypothetical protein
MMGCESLEERWKREQPRLGVPRVNGAGFRVLKTVFELSQRETSL